MQVMTRVSFGGALERTRLLSHCTDDLGIESNKNQKSCSNLPLFRVQGEARSCG